MLIRVVRSTSVPRSPTSDIADEPQRPAGDEHGDPGGVGERGRDEQAVRDDDELALRAQLEREVVRRRARVERDGLALADDRRGRARDRALPLDLEPEPEVEPDLRLPVAERADAAPHAGDEPLLREQREVAADRHLRNRKRFRKFRNRNRIAASRASAAPAASARPATNRGITRTRRCGATLRPGPRCVNSSTALAFETCRIESRFVNRTPIVQTPERWTSSTFSSASRELAIETPSWGYGNSGTRFHVYPWPGAARTVHERIADAALVHRLTGCCPSVALHIPWDATDDYGALRRYAEDLGLRIGAINPESLRLGRVPARQPLQSGCVRPRTRARPLPRVHRDRDRGRIGSDQPLARRRHELPGPGRPAPTGTDGCSTASSRCTRRSRPGCGCSSSTSSSSPASTARISPTGERPRSRAGGSGRRRRSSSTPGHHAQGTNVEQIVALLLGEGLLGGFHFNNRKYADDDLIVGSIDPFELFRIMREIARARRRRADRLHDRPVPQHRGKDRRDDPVGAEHPDRVCEGAAGRRGPAGGGPVGGRRARRPSDPPRGVRDRRAAAARAAPPASWSSRTTRSRHFAQEATPRH